MNTKKGPVVAPATLQLNTPSKRLFFVVGTSSLLCFALGMLLVVLDRQRSSDAQETLFGVGEWLLLMGPLGVLTGLFGSFLYDYTIRPLRAAYARLTEWIAAG